MMDPGINPWNWGSVREAFRSGGLIRLNANGRHD